MAQLTITTLGRVNNPPSQIGYNQINLDYNTDYTFELNDFINTIPVYLDPEGDNIDKLKILTLPTLGTLYLNGVACTVNQEISNASITSGLFTYSPDDNDGDSYIDYDFTFDLSDQGSLTYSGLTGGYIRFKVAEQVNQPPTSVGDGSVTTEWGQTVVFTKAMLSSLLSPAYSDPENDEPANLLIVELPATGELQYNGVAVLANDIISFTDIDAGLFTFVPDTSVSNPVPAIFNFEISDEGSNTFVG